MKKMILVFLALGLVTSCGKKHCNIEKKSGNALSEIVNGDHRSPENKVRDVYRHPQQTLEFFDIKPDMKVVEVSPGKGWYTEILGPYLKEKGELYLARFSKDTEVEYFQIANKALDDLMASHKDLYGKVTFTTFEPPTVVGPVAPENSVDRVITFRNVHNWMKAKKEKEAFQEFFKALKPGGIFGIVEHREKLTKIQDPEAKSGYVREDFIITLAESVGFKFVSKSEVNANYLDTANYPEGVWTLPPVLRLKDKDRAYYLSIGESDRMTLKFVKP
jgi:predicted methyltransferase